jgi:hypothetical protein
MKTTTLALLAASLMAYAVTPEVAAYRARMDHAQDLQDSLRDAVDAKDAKAVLDLSVELTSLLEEDRRYWEKHREADALTLSKESIEYTQRLKSDAAKKDFSKVSEDFNQLQKTCRSCHDAHPEKRVKQ